jgi:hypothetical protein
MKTFRFALLFLAVAAAGLAAADDADARGRYHHARARVGVFVGAPIFPYYYSPYYYPRYYYPPAVVVPPASPPVYIEQGSAPGAAAPAAQSAYWYFCQDSQTYYPYVQQCASPWQQVAPQASAAPQ